MGQKANIITLRKDKKNFNLQNLNKNVFLLGLNFMLVFKQLLNKKRVILTKESFNIDGSKLFLNLHLFFKAAKIKNFKRKNSVLEEDSNSLLHANFFNQILSQCIKTFKLSNVYIKTRVLNQFNKQNLVFLSKKLKRYSSVLFKRRLGLFFDFIKLTLLYAQEKIDLKAYLLTIAEIFKFLQKNAHSKFLAFLRSVFCILIFENKIKTSISGVKILIRGRFKGKARAGAAGVKLGAVSNQSFCKNIDFAKVHMYTKKMGALGLKLWVQKKTN